MKSSLKIRMDEFRNPVIEFLVSNSNEDLRDEMCKHFIEALQSTSNFCLIEPTYNIGQIGTLEELTRWVIKPVGKLDELKALKERVDESIRVLESQQKPKKDFSYSYRRNQMDLYSPAEKAIYYAIQEVEKAGADVKLTEAVIFLSKAKDRVADFVDNIKD